MISAGEKWYGIYVTEMRVRGIEVDSWSALHHKDRDAWEALGQSIEQRISEAFDHVPNESGSTA